MSKKVLKVYMTTCDAYFTVIYEGDERIYQYEGRALCPARIQKMIDQGKYISWEGFRWELLNFV